MIAEDEKPRSECRHCGEVEPEDEMDENHLCQACSLWHRMVRLREEARRDQ